jgi:hypothetical protein
MEIPVRYEIKSTLRVDARNVETLTDSQPANADADSAPNWLPERFGSAGAFPRRGEGFVATATMEW